MIFLNLLSSFLSLIFPIFPHPLPHSPIPLSLSRFLNLSYFRTFLSLSSSLFSPFTLSSSALPPSPLFLLFLFLLLSLSYLPPPTPIPLPPPIPLPSALFPVFLLLLILLFLSLLPPSPIPLPLSLSPSLDPSSVRPH